MLSWGLDKEQILSHMRNRIPDLRISRSDALPLSYKKNFSTNLPFYTADSNIDSMSATGRTEIPIVSYFCWPVVRTVKVHNIYEIISTNIMPRSHHLRKKKQENHKNFTLFRLNFGPIENTTFSFVMVFRIQSMVSWVFSFSFSFSFSFFFFFSFFFYSYPRSQLINSW